MTEAVTRPTANRPAAPVTIRAYRPLDHRACHGLWAELTATHRELYDDPELGGDDPGAAFEEYLTRLDLAGMWVAEHAEDGVVGMVGLVLGGAAVTGALRPGGLAGPAGQVEPVVVTQRWRGRGIGRALLTHVAAQARQRGMRQLSITPASRNAVAVRVLHAAGYERLASLTLTVPLTAGVSPSRGDGLDLHGVHFSC